MKSGKLIASAVFTAGVLGDECKYSFEIMQLQDMSDSFKDDLQTMQQLAPELFNTINSQYPGSKFGLASFVDKPLPHRGYGPYGGYQKSSIRQDFCYEIETSMSDDPTAYIDKIKNFAVGSGFDFEENQLEALLFTALDDRTGFSSPDKKYDDEGRPLAKVVIMITDAIPHVKGDANNAVGGFWNWPRTYDASGYSSGGFGADSLASDLTIYDKDSYNAILKYFHKYDSGETLSQDDVTKYKELLDKVGPYPMANPVAHPGDNSIDCGKTEYPTVEQVGKVIKERNIIPVFLLAKFDDVQTNEMIKQCKLFPSLPQDDLFKCMQGIYQQYLTDMGVFGVVGTLDEQATNIIESTMAALAQVVDEVCVTTSSTAAPKTEATTTTQKKTEAPTTQKKTEAPTTQKKTEATTTQKKTEATTTQKTSPATTTTKAQEVTFPPYDNPCNYVVEVLQLQDASDSFTDDMKNMKQSIPALFQAIKETYPGSKMGMSSFVDKPIPMRGYGPYGGFQYMNVVMDFCYRRDLSLTNDQGQFVSAIEHFETGSGFDVSENQLEAFIRASYDENIGFSTTSKTADGKDILKMVIMVTDAIPHQPGDAASATTNWWNWPITYNGMGFSTGGFGSDQFSFMSNGVIGDVPSYTALAQLLKIQNVGGLTPDEQSQLSDLIKKVGPFPWPPIQSPHPGDDSVDCEVVEYPSLEQAAAALRRIDVVPAILLGSVGVMDDTLIKACTEAGLPSDHAHGKECVTGLYENYLKEMGLGGSVASLTGNSENFVADMMTMINTIAQAKCQLQA